jgi:TatD DNase family protein
MNLRIFDSHAHLYFPDFADDFPEVARRAREAGVERLINIGVHTESSRKCLELAKGIPGYHASVGWHPHVAEKLRPENLTELAELAQESGALAVGEIGLDFYQMRSPMDVQLRAFQELLDVAQGSGKPVIIHSREAFRETHDILKARLSGLHGILIHCFGGDEEEAGMYLDLGAYISIPGTLTYKSSEALRDAVRSMPRDRVLVETDAPFLPPVPRRGKRNEPSFLPFLLKVVAGLWDCEPEEAADITFRNASAFFGLAEDASAPQPGAPA